MATIRQHATRLDVPLIRARALALELLAQFYAKEYDDDNPDGELLDGIYNALQIEVADLNLLLTPDLSDRDTKGNPRKYTGD